MILNLPFPPSVNQYYRSPNKGPLAGRTLISEKGRAYRDAVRILASAGKPIAGRVAVVIEAFMPDNRRRDLDNLTKALLDSLTHAGVWLDDSQIDDLRIIRRGVLKGGLVRVCIAESTP